MSGPHRSSVRLGRSRRLALYVVGCGVWTSGALWLLFHYLLVQQGEFGPKISTLEPWWLKLHGAFAFATLWIFGLLWGVHVTSAWPLNRRRWSGGILTGLLIWLSVTGYLLYYAADENARSWISVLHWTFGLAIPLAFISHRYRFRKRRATLRRRSSNSELIQADKLVSQTKSSD